MFWKSFIQPVAHCCRIMRRCTVLLEPDIVSPLDFWLKFGGQEVQIRFASDDSTIKKERANNALAPNSCPNSDAGRIGFFFDGDPWIFIAPIHTIMPVDV